MEIIPNPVEFDGDSVFNDIEQLTLSPLTAPVGGDLVVRLTASNDDFAFNANGNDQRDVTFPADSTAPQIINVRRRTPNNEAGSGSIQVNLSPDNQATNFTNPDVSQTVDVIIAEGDPNLLVDPDPVEFDAIDDIVELTFELSEAPVGGSVTIQLSNQGDPDFDLGNGNDTITRTLNAGDPGPRTIDVNRTTQSMSGGQIRITVLMSGANNYPVGSIDRLVDVILDAQP